MKNVSQDSFGSSISEETVVNMQAYYSIAVCHRIIWWLSDPQPLHHLPLMLGAGVLAWSSLARFCQNYALKPLKRNTWCVTVVLKDFVINQLLQCLKVSNPFSINHDNHEVDGHDSVTLCSYLLDMVSSCKWGHVLSPVWRWHEIR